MTHSAFPITWATPMVSVDDRPQAICIERLNQTNDQIVANFKVVAILDGGDCWAAYFGPCTWSEARIASGGTKLDADSARRLFPNISQRYRG
jgi:hypothetical protein